MSKSTARLLRIRYILSVQSIDCKLAWIEEVARQGTDTLPDWIDITHYHSWLVDECSEIADSIDTTIRRTPSWSSIDLVGFAQAWTTLVMTPVNWSDMTCQELEELLANVL